MTQSFDDEFAAAQPFDEGYGDEHRHRPRRRRWVGAAIVAGLALFGVASALLWHAWGDGLPAFPSVASVTAPAAAPEVDKPVGSKDFQAFQQQIAGSLQSTAQLLATQQAEIKRLSDQVIALTAKIDALQRPSAQAAAPTPPPPAPQKKPAAPKKPAAAISVGGAPLPASGR